MLVAAAGGFAQAIGVEFDAIAKDRVVARIRLAPHHRDEAGCVHAVVFTALADAAAARAAALNRPDANPGTPLRSEVSFVGTTQCDEIFAESVPLHLGASTTKWETAVRDADGHLLAVLVQTRLVAAGSSRRPSSDADEADPDAIAATPVRPSVSDASAGSRPHDGWSAPERAQTTTDIRRAQILRAAFKVISRKGFSNAATREIAQEAGLSVPAMYQYVRSKDELLEAIFNTYLNTVEASVQSSVTGSSTATDKLRASIAANMAEFDRFQAQIRVMNRETKALRPEVRQRVKKHMLDYVDLFRSIIDEGIASGEFRKVDSGLYANFVPMLCEVWPLRNWALGTQRVSDVSDAIVDLLLHALAPVRAKRKAA